MMFTVKPLFILLRFYLHYLRKMESLINVPTSVTSSFYSISVRTLIPSLQTTSGYLRYSCPVYTRRIFNRLMFSIFLTQFICFRPVLRNPTGELPVNFCLFSQVNVNRSVWFSCSRRHSSRTLKVSAIFPYLTGNPWKRVVSPID